MELSEYADSIQDVYEKNIDDIINGLYDKSEDIPDTYGDAWEAATEETWEDKVDLEEGTPSGGGGKKPEEDEKEPEEGETSDGDGEGDSETIELSEKNIQHIKKHTFDGIAEQAKYLTDEQLADKLSNTSFFNKNWSQDEVIQYTQEAYNILRSQGKTGLQSIEINGEIINVFIKEDGAFGTAYGIYRFTVEDFR